MDININACEMEKQRRQRILDSGKYLKFEMVIGKEQETIGNHIGVIPYTELTMHKVGPTEVGALYLCLQELSNLLEKEYPEACLMAKLTQKCSNLGDYDMKEGKEDDK